MKTLFATSPGRRLALVVLTVAHGATFAPTAAAGGPITGDLATSLTSQTGRVTQGKASTCGTSRTPAIANSGSNFKYASFAFVNGSGSDECFSFAYNSPSNTNLGLAAYLGSFNPSNVTQNFLGGYDVLSSCAGKSGTLSVLVPAGQTMILVVSECTTGGGGQYQLLVDAHPASYMPDGRIKKGSGALVGNDIYNADGTGQSVSATKARGETATFTISIQADGNTADRFKVAAAGSAVTGYSVKFFRGLTEITGTVNAGTYQTGLVLPGDAWLLTAKVKVLKHAAMGSSINRLVTLTSTTNGYQYDAVKFTVHRQ